MKPFTTITADERKSEFCVDIGDKELGVNVKYYADGHVWVSVDEWHQVSPTYGHWWCVLASENVTDVANDLDAIRECFHGHKYRLKRTVRDWQSFVNIGRAEQNRGKKAYYSKLANETKARIPELAARWKLCKQLWKEITKL